MQKRVGLARAIAADPQVIFFDEPTTGLDPIMAGVINTLIRRVVTDLGVTAVTITHDMSSVDAIADRVAMLHDGTIRWISVISGLQSLWGTDVILALIVTVFALFAPYLKTIGLALVHFNLLQTKTLPALSTLGKLAMADVFLIALYVVIAKGVGIGTLETAWGLYLFTACILASLLISILTPKEAS